MLCCAVLHIRTLGTPATTPSDLKRFKKMFPTLSWADIIQMASATAVETAGGPKIPMRYGRVDTATPEECPPEGNLPGAAPPFDDAAGSNPFPGAQDPVPA